jgi:hypothetical protein
MIEKASLTAVPVIPAIPNSRAGVAGMAGLIYCYTTRPNFSGAWYSSKAAGGGLDRGVILSGRQAMGQHE